MTSRDLIEQSGIKDNDRVVCIDDAYQRLDLADAPDGLLVRGRVYCVSGVSECGGLLLAGVRAISSRTHKEVGFHPSRFCPLEKFRKGVASSSPADDEADYPEPRKPVAFPELEGLEEPKPLVYKVVEVLEEMCHDYHDPERTPPWLEIAYGPDQSPQHVRLELLALLASPERVAYMNQAWRFWHFLVDGRKPTVLFCRERSPVANVLFQMCMRGNILTERFLEGDLRERDFPALTVAAGRFAHAAIRICDVREPGTFMEVLAGAHQAFQFALCDWILAGGEMAAAYHLTRDSQITFMCPQRETLPPEPDD